MRLSRLILLHDTVLLTILAAVATELWHILAPAGHLLITIGPYLVGLLTWILAH